jgi:hypothetical protein
MFHNFFFILLIEVQACDTKWIFEFPTGKYSVKGHGSLNSRGVCVRICGTFRAIGKISVKNGKRFNKKSFRIWVYE